MPETMYLSNSAIQILTILLGIVVLVAGRKLFWVTVGVAGFMFGLLLTFNVLQDQPAWLTLVLALVIGLVGAFVAVIVQKAVVALAGLLIGGYLFASLLVAWNPALAEWQWLAFIIGAVIGFVVMIAIFEVGLVILSAMLGAVLILQVINLESWLEGLLLIVMVMVGVLIQLKLTSPAPPPPPPSPPVSQRAKRTQ